MAELVDRSQQCSRVASKEVFFVCCFNHQFECFDHNFLLLLFRPCVYWTIFWGKSQNFPAHFNNKQHVLIYLPKSNLNT